MAGEVTFGQRVIADVHARNCRCAGYEYTSEPCVQYRSALAALIDAQISLTRLGALVENQACPGRGLVGAGGVSV